MRNGAVHLNEKQKYQVAKFIIENRGVIVDETGRFTKFRVGKSQLAEEVSAKLQKVTVHSITESMNFYNLVLELSGNLAVPPPHQETMEEDRLKIEIAQLKNGIEKLHNENAYLVVRINDSKKLVEEIKSMLKKV